MRILEEIKIIFQVVEIFEIGSIFRPSSQKSIDKVSDCNQKLARDGLNLFFQAYQAKFRQFSAPHEETNCLEYDKSVIQVDKVSSTSLLLPRKTDRKIVGPQLKVCMQKTAHAEPCLKLCRHGDLLVEMNHLKYETCCQKSLKMHDFQTFFAEKQSRNRVVTKHNTG